MTTDRFRNLTPIEIAFAAFLLWGLLSSHLGCSG
jgi:hypothetical protein